MNDKMREEFEEWAAEEAEVRGVGALLGLMTDEHHDRYSMIWTQTAWMAWQASRKTLVIELPEPYAVVGDYAACGGGRSVWDVEYAEKITDRMCQKTPVYDRASLEAAGLKVKAAMGEGKKS